MKTIQRKLCAILCATALFGVLTPTASAATFTDVSGHWAAGYIETCAGRGIVDGVGGGKFEPEGRVTNVQFVKMLCTAFYNTEEQTFESENRDAINIYFNGSIQWYSGKSCYFAKMGLLTNVDYNILSSVSADQPMNRTNMAQVAANVLVQKGIAANESDKSLAQATLMYVNDYYNIPENNRDAVKTCYALGVITGTDGGKFDGGNTMTRAQACAVIIRLLDVVGKTSNAPTPIETPTTPVTLDPIVKDIQVMSRTITNGTAWAVADNGFATGYLNNGEPIIEEIVIELLHEAQKIWNIGMTWAASGTANNNCYDATNTAAITLPGIANNYKCPGFAKLLSYYVFGKNANPAHKVTNFADIRPGDIIISDTLNHAMVVTVKVTTGTRAGAVYVAEGNVSNKVDWGWPETKSAWNAWMPSDLGTFTVYSRYPD